MISMSVSVILSVGWKMPCNMYVSSIWISGFLLPKRCNKFFSDFYESCSKKDGCYENDKYCHI